MRSALLVAITLILLAGGYVVYWELQPPSRAGQETAKAIVSVPPKQNVATTLKQIQPGNNAFFLEFDPVTGDLVRKFRAKEYVPQKNGTILVKTPEVWFYSANRQQVHLTGTDGEVVLKQVPDLSINGSAGQDKAPPAPPNRGHLNHVTIYLIDPDPKNNLVMTTNNVQFDNDTMLISTESFIDEQGHLVAADEVPVHVEGNYKFDGRGLTMRWNEKDGRLEMLEIAHGQSLEIDDTSGISGFTSGKTVPATQPAAAQGPVALVAADPAAAGEAIKADQGADTRLRNAKRARPPTAPTPYLATFYENVTITQGELALITGERMEVQFMTRQDQSKAATHPATNESGAGAANEGSSLPTTNSTATAPVTKPATVQNTTVPATQPTTKPADPPVFVRWTGKLTIIPTPPDKRLSVPGGSAVVSLFGKPVTILRTDPASHERTDIRSAVSVFHTFDRSASLFNSRDVAEVIVKKFAAGKADPTSTVTAASIDYSGAQRVAVLAGPGHVLAPADDNAPDKGNLDVRWDRFAKVYLTESGKSRDELAVEHMDLAGHVDVHHPQLALRSQELSLFFAPVVGTPVALSTVQPATLPSTRPARNTLPQTQLQRVLATTDVWCELINAEKKKQTVEGDRLEMLTAQTPSGQFQPRQLNAQGSVHAFDEQQDLRAGNVELTLKPSAPVTTSAAPAPKLPQTRPADQGPQVELERMHATEHVIVTRPDHSIVTGEDLEITTENNEPHVRLAGAPDAQVIDAKKNVMTGPLIQFEPKRQLGHILGVGSVHMMPDQGGQPADVHWTDRADFDGIHNTIDAVGQIAFTTLDKDGSIINGDGQRIHIDLQNKPPSTQPSTRRSAPPSSSGAALPAAAELPKSNTSGPTTRKARSSGAMDDPMKMDAMGDKDLKAITLDGDARVISTLNDDKGTLLRRTEIKGGKLIYQLAGTDAQPAHSLLVPGTGRLLMQDHMPTEKRPAKDSGSGIESGQGDTAFQWQDHMLYSELQHQALMVGKVHIVHRTLGSGQEPMYVDADQVTANFEPAPAKPATLPSKPTTAPANVLGASNGSLHLRNVQADGHVSVMRAGSRLEAQRIDFDPNTHELIAHGSAEQPAVYTSATGTNSATADEIHWNTQTWHIQAHNTTLRGRGK